MYLDDVRSSNEAVRSKLRWPLPISTPTVEVLDATVIMLTGVASGLGYHFYLHGFRGDTYGFLAVSVVVATLFVLTGSLRDLYSLDTVRRPLKRMRRLVAIWTLTFLFLGTVAFGLKIGAQFSRGFIVLFAFGGLLSLVACRLTYASLIAKAEARGLIRTRPVLLIGPAEIVRNRETRLALDHAGFSVTRAFGWQPGEALAVTTHALAASRGSDVEEVFLAGDTANWHALRDLLRAQPLPVHLVLDDDLASLVRRSVKTSKQVTFVEVQRGPLSAGERHAKRALDIAVAGTALVLLLPLLALAGLAVKLDSPGPVLFRQNRHGFNGRRFRILKFRSMSVQEDGPEVRQASRNDSRVTRVGRWLRRTSVDELPQLLNVLSGEMSIVGPRPHAIAHDDHYDRLIANYAFRHHMKPGLTGWAQVNGYRGETRDVDSMARRVEHDIWYVDNHTIALDIRIMCRTFLELVRTRQAY